MKKTIDSGPAGTRIPITAASLLGIALTCLTLSGCSSAGIVRSADPAQSLLGQRSVSGTLALADSSARIRTDDQIQISVWGYPEFDVTTPVKPSGTVVIPLIGELRAVDLTKEEFTTRLKARLAEYVKQEPTVTVAIVSMAGMKVSVMGAVTRQDNYPLTGDAPLVEVLLSAGGTTPEADLHHVVIFRSGLAQNAINVDVPSHMSRGEVSKMPKVRIGDTVFVPKQENLVRDLSGFVTDVLMMFGLFGILH